MLYLTMSQVDFLAAPVMAKQTQFRYKSKRFVIGELLPGNARAVATAACRRYLDEGTFCLIVVAADQLGLCFEYEGAVDVAVSVATPTAVPTPELTLEDRCELALAEHIGPIAKVVCKRAFSEYPEYSDTQMVDYLAAQIGNEEAAAAFKQSVAGAAPPVTTPAAVSTPEFLLEDRCELKLSEHIGPIAKVVCKRAFSEHPEYSDAQMIDYLAAQIDDKEAAATFKQRLGS